MFRRSRVIKYLFIICFGSHRSAGSHLSRTDLFGTRHVQCVLIFFGLLLAYAMRVNMSLAIVAMTDSNDNSAFEWSVQARSVVMSSFFWGYVILQVPGGELANRFGGKVLLATSVGINSILIMIIPVCAMYGGWQIVVVCRVLQGLFQGVTFPSVHNLLGKWVPVEEKSRLGQFVYSGSQLGTALQLMSAGYVADRWGWPMIFYSVGILGMVWTVFYLEWGDASPQSSYFITPQERDYIQSSLGTTQEYQKLHTPWSSILTSKPFLALILVHCGQNWGFWTLLTEIPSYMQRILRFYIMSNGVLSALPYLAMYILSFVFSITLDHCHKKQWISLSVSRKISNSIGFYVAAAALIGIAYAPANSVIAPIVLLIIAVGVNAGHITGLVLVHIDMAPNFAGTLMGITNFLANIVSIIVPLVAGVILKDESDPVYWKMLFFLAAAVYVVTNTVFIIFGTCERQTWNDPNKENKPLIDGVAVE